MEKIKSGTICIDLMKVSSYNHIYDKVKENTTKVFAH